jgi:hypothetical protein
MLVSQDPKFIFIHIPKSAGQSVVNALMPFGSRKYQKLLRPLLSYRMQLKLNSALKRYLNVYLQPQPFDDHIRALNLRNEMGGSIYEKYFSFTFVRNPWDRLYSTYNYTRLNSRHGRNKLLHQFADFNEYIEWHCTEDSLSKQIDWVCDPQGRQIVEYIGRFETINKDFDAICNRLGISASLPEYNASSTGDYRSEYSKYSQDLVGDAYVEDIEYFGYKF